MSDVRKPRQKIRLGDLLVKHKIISERQLEEALAEQKRSGHKLGRVLVQLGHVAEDDLLDFLGQQLDVPVIDLKHYNFKPQTVRLLPETHARRYRAIVLAEDKDELTVGMADPTDIFGFDALRNILKKPINIVLVRESDLVRTIDIVYRRTEEISSLAEELGEELSGSDYDISQLEDDEGQVDAPVIKLLRSMFEDAVQIGASDIHIEPDESVLRVRQRVDGELQEQIIEGRRVASALVTRLKLMASLNISEKRLPQDGRFSLRVKDHNIDVRLSTMPIQYGESMVMRLLDQSAGLLELDKLGIPEKMEARIRRLINRPSGMMLVTGPTGSGKTTTLYAALNQINQSRRKIITVEDPVEYRLPRINQVQVNPKIELDFARVLRTALRQDPDIIMVGEMRDRETAEIGLRAAMTGHLVLSTLHTNSAPATVMRLVDMGAQGFMVAAALDGVLAQRLVRRVCDTCGEDAEPDSGQLAWVRSHLGEEKAEDIRFRAGHGCAYCSNTGYRGRIGVYELLEMDEELTDALRRMDTAAFARLARTRTGYRPLIDCALDYAREGITSLEEVIRLAGGLDELLDSQMDPITLTDEAS
ncbi:MULTISPECIES: GspE/PulE family protein [unclassified Wenzhouxiangella]|uniref:GspE/PulE family protein n=1 Tax=unclassified Wenzhouxiangella TaxID=2613841 RepID=UPI000E32C3FA|nr:MULTISPECIES: GspE/PulE family protein [unclassified Wenzhouxiangella]RFF28289.1 type II/IV secretion system protein [Wenzhouxiangella sp. 15181]RFP67786.1 type II/IV secretion system protein [Wenzhouxiangella sp. 15190]